ncbi:toxin glutamine deamidase domain-containing protein [Pectobacterium odoriferum]|uniref:toxin glutamine deamidase domain-containing protein n=1 Tax=Pectobacterium odoriferum TaxID=78398 RepID=UPI0021560A01|nr:toxin glutamine deamidase domain-containing protein [Pectobacterium odoriferum]
MAGQYPGKTANDLTEEEKQSVSALSTLASGLVSGLAGNSTASAASGAQSGRNAVENNALSSKDEKQRQDAKWSLPYIKDEKQKQQADKLISELNEKDELFNAAIDAACQNLSSAACQGMRQELSAMAKSYDEQMDGQYIGTMRSVYGDGAKQVDGLMWQYATADMKAQREADIIRLMDKGISREVAEGLSLGMRTVHGLAAIGGAVYGMKGTGVAGESAGTIRNVNPGYPVSGRTHNCVNCSIATDATLAGNPASALPIYSTKGVPLPVLEKHYGTKFKYVSSTENIIQQMTNAGSGSRGIVYGSYGVGQPGHVFNVVNQNGVVRFLDGQSGKAADLSQFKSFQLLRTNK